jgi:hypothetical protein
LALAFLGSRRTGRREESDWAFELFWRALEEPKEQDRGSQLTGAINGIYLAVERKRELAMVSHFERRARQTEPPPEPSTWW